MSQVAQQLAEIRRYQKQTKRLCSLIHTLKLENYADLLSWVFEVQTLFRDVNSSLYFPFLDDVGCSIFQAEFGVYFDIALSAFENRPKQDYLKLIVVCLGLAIKFNETRQVSEQLTPPSLFMVFQISISSQYVNQLEIIVWQSLGYRMCFTSPDDYLESFLSQFPFYQDIFRTHLPKFIELALLHPSACQFTSQEIFYGAFCALLKASKIVMDNHKRRILSEITSSWDRATGVARLIKKIMDEANKDCQEN